MDENTISGKIIGAAIEVHRILGAGLLESVYQQCLVRELELQGILVISEVPISADYKGLTFDVVYRTDLLVEDKEWKLNNLYKWRSDLVRIRSF